jgi:hypothetical protein
MWHQTLYDVANKKIMLVNYWSMWHQTLYDVANKNNNVS